MIMVSFLKKNIFLIITVIVVLALAVGGYKYYQKKQADSAAPVKLASVQKGDIRSTISATGALSAVDNVDINSKITGRIVEVYVQENQHVKAGQHLLRLDDTTLMATQTQMEAKLRDAQAKYNRYSALVAEGAVARSEYDTAEADYIVAREQYASAVSNTADTIITSPIDGYVIGKPTPVGQTVSSGISSPQVIMSIANLDNMQIELLVDESDIGRVRVGQKVEFTVDSYPDITFKGSVRLVSRKAVTNNNVIYYTVYVDVANSDGKLLPTMTARADIIVGEVNDVLTVPITCLRTQGKKKYVQTYNEKTKAIKDVNVTVGMTGDENIEVKGELNAGDKLLVKEVKTSNKGNNRKMMGGPRF